MHWTAPGRALIAWDSGQGPHFARGPGGAYLKRKAFESFDVYRTADPAELTGILIGTTRAEAFFDTDAPEGLMVWYRVVGRTKDGGTIPVGARVPVTIPTRSFASADTMPPSPPDNFKVRPRSTGKLLTWHAACDAESGLLAYMVYDADQDQPDSVVWANDTVQAKSHAVRRFLDRTTNKKKRYRLRAIDCALNLSEGGPVAGKSADGWTVYTFSASSQFTIAAKETLDADTLIVAGGGAGGATNNSAAGGGGAGEMKDLHKVTITGGGNDGEVIVGAGGTLSHVVGDGSGADGPNEVAGDSSFAGFTARGGGRGGELWIVDLVTPGQSVRGAPGGSGGGGLPWNDRIPGYDGLEATDIVERAGGHATATPYAADTDIPYGDGTVASFNAYARENGYPSGDPVDFWENDAGEKFWVVEHAGGYDGRPADSGGYSVCVGGGGGGAHQFWWGEGEGEARFHWFTYDQFGEMEGGYSCNAMHGRPCDIRGWHMYEETAKQLMFVDWYSGGGAGGAWLPGGWSWSGYASKPGYGGGGGYSYQGPSGQHGADNSGGGGCGGFNNFAIAPPYIVEAGNGGSGIVVIRIRTADEDLVTYPLITGTDPDPEHNEFGLPVCLCDDPHVTIRRLPEYMTHNDESGDEQCPRTYEETHA